MLNIHSIIPKSAANGPGTRFVIWFQGCTLGCAECFNPETHSHEPVLLLEVNDLIAQITDCDDNIEGITISGGEPFEQPDNLLKLLLALRKQTSLSVVIFSGRTREEILLMPLGKDILPNVDVLIDGRFDKTKCLSSGLRGSSNQVIHLLTSRYTIADIESTPSGEIIIDNEGNITISGITPILLE